MCWLERFKVSSQALSHGRSETKRQQGIADASKLITRSLR